MTQEQQNKLADLIIERFTPFAFSCTDSEGNLCSEPTCVMARESVYNWGQVDTVNRIAEYIRQLLIPDNM